MDEHMVLALFHILFVAPLFLTVGILRTDLPPWIFQVLLGLGIILFLYQGYKFVVRVMAGSGKAWINAIHVFLVAPLLIYVGWRAEGTPRAAFEMVLLLGFAALGYHSYNLVKELTV
jgi:hypothetical protein